MVKKVPGFFYSSYRETAYDSPVLISNRVYNKIAARIHEDDYNNRGGKK